MKKDIKIAITGTLLSVFLFALGMFILNNASFIAVFKENYVAVKLITVFCVFLAVAIGFFGIITFVILTITFIGKECYNKRTDKYKLKFREKIENEIPKDIEFDVNIVNQNNVDINKLLYQNLKCTALFDGKTVYIKYTMPKEVNIETDDVFWFSDNFKY